MSRYLLDTDTITLIQFGHATAAHCLSAQRDADVTLSAFGFQPVDSQLPGPQPDCRCPPAVSAP
jgi:hypothetical protein